MVVARQAGALKSRPKLIGSRLPCRSLQSLLANVAGNQSVTHADVCRPGSRSESTTSCSCCRARRGHAEAICRKDGDYTLLRMQSKLRRWDHSSCRWCLQSKSTALLMLQGKLGRMQKFLDKLHNGEQTSVSFLGASVSTAYCLHETIG